MSKLLPEAIIDMINKKEEIGRVLWDHWTYLGFAPNENTLNDIINYFAGAGLSSQQLDSLFKTIEPKEININSLKESNNAYGQYVAILMEKNIVGSFDAFLQGLEVTGRAPEIYNYFKQISETLPKQINQLAAYYLIGATYFDPESEELYDEALEAFNLLNNEDEIKGPQDAFVSGLYFYIVDRDAKKVEIQTVSKSNLIDDLIKIIIDYI